MIRNLLQPGYLVTKSHHPRLDSAFGYPRLEMSRNKL